MTDILLAGLLLMVDGRLADMAGEAGAFALMKEHT